ncbi:cytochrome c biogenesis protein CcdA, partial [Streptomyces sp. NPDC052127]
MSAVTTLAATGYNDTVLNGALLVALPIALLGGLVSFFSPCVLPLVPGYLSYVTGVA